MTFENLKMSNFPWVKTKGDCRLPIVIRNILKMSRNKSFDVRARFGAIYSASKTKKYLLKNNTIGNRLLFSKLANTEFTCPKKSNW